MQYLMTICLSYLIGTSNMATYLARWKKVDLKAGGSKNPGASNTMLLMGWRAGILVALHDILKATLAVYLCMHLFPGLAYVGTIAGVSCVIGHMFPFWLKFQGGKGFASYIGMTIALNWKLAIFLCLAIILLTLITDYIVVGTMTTVLSVPAFYALIHEGITALILCIATAIIIYKHRQNLVRIANGTEIGLRGGHRGEHRVK